MSISILPGDRSASVQLQSPACRDGEFPQPFGRALEDAELWGEPLTLLWTHPQPGAGVLALPVQDLQVGCRDGAEIKHRAGASSGRWCELLLAV